MLTTGLGLRCDQAALAACVDRLGDAGIAASASGRVPVTSAFPSAVVGTAGIRRIPLRPRRPAEAGGAGVAPGLRFAGAGLGSDHDHGHQLAMEICLCTVAGSPSSVSMQAARSAREIVNPRGRLRSVAVR